jgi:hypothetical protein
MTILIDPEKSQVDALEAQARATRALAHEHKRANDLRERAHNLRELEIILSTMTKEEQKEYLAKREADANAAIASLLKTIGVIILVIVIYIWLR